MVLKVRLPVCKDLGLQETSIRVFWGRSKEFEFRKQGLESRAAFVAPAAACEVKARPCPAR